MPEVGTILLFGMLGILSFFLLVSLVDMFFIVPQQHVYVVERFGQYLSLSSAGLNLKWPFFDRVAHRLSLQVEELDPVEVETQTSDGVVATLTVVVQVQVVNDAASVFRACYELDDPYGQIETYTIDAVRASVPKLSIAQIYQQQGVVEDYVNQALQAVMGSCGFQIKRVNVTHVELPDEVKKAMNQVVASQRLREAATNEAEAAKTRVVKEAEANRDALRLQGEGMSAMHKAVTDGLAGVDGMTAEMIADLLAVTLTTRAWHRFAESPNGTHTVLLPPAQGGMGDLLSSLIAAQAVKTTAGVKRGKTG